MEAHDISDIRNVVDSLRQFITGSARCSDNEIKRLANEHASACMYANERLQQCRDFLRRGLRSEAIHAAQVAPNVLDMIATLDFEGRDIWEDVCENHGLTAAPGLLTEVAAELNEAYTAELPIRELLERHRRAALSRAPLKDRLQILHKLAKTDSENDTWELDVKEYEKERFREVEKEFREAVSENDLGKLMEIRRELGSENWQILNVADARKAADSSITKVNARHSRSEIVKIVELLRDAHAAMNVQEGRRLRDDWQRHALVAGLQVNDSLSQEAAPSLQWLALEDKRDADERRYQSALSAMEQALDDSAPHEEIERLYYALGNFDRPIPAMIEARFRGRSEQHNITTKRKSHLLIIGAVIAVLLVGTLTIFLVNYSIYNRNVAIATESLDHLIQNRLFEKADEYLVALKSSDENVAASPQVQECLARLDAAKKDESARVQRFNTLFTQLQEAKIDIEDPPALKDLRELAKNEQERSRIESLLSARQTERAAIQREADDQFRKLVDEGSALADEVASALAKDDPIEDAAAKTMCEKLSTKIEEIRLKKDASSPSLQSLLIALENRHAELSRSLYNHDRGREAFGRMMAAFNENSGEAIITSYIAASKNWLESRPDLKGSNEWKASLQEEDVWKSAAGWSAISRLLAPPTKVSPRIATDIRGKLDKYLEDHKRCVNAAAIEEYSKFLGGIGNRSSEDGPQQRIEKLFSNRLLIDTWAITEPSGRTYYTLSEPPKVFDSGTNNVKYVTDYDFKVRTGLIKPGSKTSRSPQRDIAVWVTEQFSKKQMTNEEWDQNGTKLFQDIISNSAMHPILKASLLYRVADSLIEGNPLLAKDLENVVSELNKIKERYNLDSNWMDPDDEQAQESKEPVSRELNRISLPKDLVSKSAEAATNKWRGLKVAYQPIGFLIKDTTGAWRVRSAKEGSPAEHELVVFRVGKGDSIESIHLGKLKAGEVVQSKDESTLAEGRVVFAQIPADQS